MNGLNDIFLDNLKRKMLDSKVLAKDIANILGFTPSYVSRMLSGSTPFRLDDVGKLCDNFGWDPVELIAAPGEYDVRELIRQLDPDHWQEFEHLKDELSQLRDLMIRIEADRAKQQEIINKLTLRLLDGR